MELLLWLALLYGALCVVPVPRHARLVARGWRGARIAREAGLHGLPPRPSAAAWVAEGLPFSLVRDGVVCEHPIARWGQPAIEAPRHASFEALRTAQARGTLVRLGRRPLLRCSHPASARRFAALLRAIGSNGDPEGGEELAAFLSHSLSERALRESYEASRQATRALGVACDVSLALWLGVAPVWMGIFGAERAIWVLAPIAGLAHLTCWLLLIRALRRLPAEGREPTFEMLATTLLFPPSLLRAPQDLLRGQLAVFHPAAATALVDPEHRLAWLQRDLARVEADAPADPGRKLERDRILALAAAHGVTEACLRRPRENDDPIARSYCPVCGADYRVPRIECHDCHLATVAYPAPGSVS